MGKHVLLVLLGPFSVVAVTLLPGGLLKQVDVLYLESYLP